MPVRSRLWQREDNASLLCERRQLVYAPLEEAALGVGGRKREGSATVKQNIPEPAAAKEVGVGGVKELVIREARVDVEGGEQGEASIRPSESTTPIARSLKVADGRRGDLTDAGAEDGDAREVRPFGRRLVACSAAICACRG